MQNLTQTQYRILWFMVLNSTTYSLEKDNRADVAADKLSISLHTMMGDVLVLEKFRLIIPVPLTQCYAPTEEGIMCVRDLDIHHKRLNQDW